MRILQITFEAIRRDADGFEKERTTDRAYIKMRDDIAQDAQNGIYDMSLILAIQHIAELQGYNIAHITSICG